MWPSQLEPYHVCSKVACAFFKFIWRSPVLTLTPRHDFYESDERLTLSIYVRGADPEQVKVNFTETSVSI